MKTMIRKLAVLVSCALSSALFAGSIDLSSSATTIDIGVSGPSDVQIQLLNTDTNQLVADMTMYTGSASIYNGGNTYVSGVSLTFGSGSVSITGVASGNYRIITILPMPWNWSSYSSSGGGWGDLWDSENNYPYGLMYYGISNVGGWFY